MHHVDNFYFDRRKPLNSENQDSWTRFVIVVCVSGIQSAVVSPPYLSTKYQQTQPTPRSGHVYAFYVASDVKLNKMLYIVLCRETVSSV